MSSSASSGRIGRLNGPAIPSAGEPPTGSGRTVWHYVSAWFPVLFCVLVIATESTVYFGADHTSGPLRALVEFFLGPINSHQWDRVHLAIRKTGHFSGYGFLSIAWFRAFWMSLHLRRSIHAAIQRRLAAHALAMLGTLLVASSDEIHQHFLPNRSGSPWDVLIDCSGGLLMQVLIWMWMSRRANS